MKQFNRAQKPWVQQGFSIIELMIVVAIMAIIAAVAYPRYMDYLISGKRTDMMSRMQNIASTIEGRKVSAGRGGYKNVKTSDLIGSYPDGNPDYTVSISNVGQGASGIDVGKYTITATPVAGGVMANDGVLTLNYQGLKCRKTHCGMGEEWKNAAK